MNNFYKILLIKLLLFSCLTYGQVDNLLGTSSLNLHPNVYDFSSAISPKIEIKLWGLVKNPGIYRIPEGTNLAELITYSGGLNDLVELDEIRIIRQTRNKNEFETIIINYENILESNDDFKNKDFHFKIIDGDIVYLPKDTHWLESLKPYTSIITTISSVLTLIYLFDRVNN